MEKLTSKLLRGAFPYGATVARNDDEQNDKLVDLELRDVDGQLFLFGWAYPNKDVWILVDSGEVEVTEDGDWLFTSNKVKTRFTPLSRSDGKSLSEQIKDV